MKMDVIWAQSPKIGIGHAVTKFGDDSLLLSSKKLGEDTALLGLTKTKKEEKDSTAKITGSVTSAPERDKMDYQTIATLVKKRSRALAKKS